MEKGRDQEEPEVLEELPWPLTEERVRALREGICAAAARLGPATAATYRPFVGVRAMRTLLVRAAEVLAREANVVAVAAAAPGARVCVVGDTHGQLYDLCAVLDRAAAAVPRVDTLVFTGDYVDRGAWGAECLALLLALRLRAGVPAPGAVPRVVLLRGNHECMACIGAYGFADEVRAKYGAALLPAVRTLFCALPLAAVVRPRPPCSSGVLALHGGLWRRASSSSAAGGGGTDAVGTLEDLARIDRTRYAELCADGPVADLCWSDPRAAPGVAPNAMRGIGLEYGPDVAAAFLRAHGLQMLVRSHEGPDARLKRAGAMPPIDQGYSIDHCWPGTARPAVITVFSAPDYPQFRRPSPPSSSPTTAPTLGAFIELTAPSDPADDTWQYRFVQYPAVPHPPGVRYGSMY